MRRFRKRPVEVLDYHVNVSQVMEEGMAITEVWIVEDPANTIELLGHTVLGADVRFDLAGGEDGSVNKYKIGILASGDGRLMDFTQLVEVHVQDREF